MAGKGMEASSSLDHRNFAQNWHAWVTVGQWDLHGCMVSDTFEVNKMPMGHSGSMGFALQAHSNPTWAPLWAAIWAPYGHVCDAPYGAHAGLKRDFVGLAIWVVPRTNPD